MGLWGVYSSFMILNNHTAATFKRGLLRISGHIIIAVFILFASLFFVLNLYVFSVFLILICFFILGYLLACGENMRAIGVAGGVGLGIMLFEYPFQGATIKVALFRAGIIIFSGLFSIIFDNLVFPSKTVDLLKNSIQNIFNKLNLVQKNICQKNYSEALNHINDIDSILLTCLKYSNDIKFQPVKLKESISQLTNLLSMQKELLYQYKSLLIMLNQPQSFIVNEKIQAIEENLNTILEIKLQNISAKNINYLILKDTSNEDKLLAQIREHALPLQVNFDDRAFVYSRISKIFQILKTISHYKQVY
jgi:hypothetical protein